MKTLIEKQMNRLTVRYLYAGVMMEKARVHGDHATYTHYDGRRYGLRCGISVLEKIAEGKENELS